MRKFLAIIGLVVGLAAIVVEFAILLPQSMDDGRSFALSIIYYFSFFTILANLAIVVIYAGAIVRGRRWLSLFRRPMTRATAAAAILLVSGFYHFALADLWHPEGLWLVCDIALHYVAPALYMIWFAIWNRTGTLKWNLLPKMLLVPALYLVYVFARGAVTHEYPYPIFDINILGIGQVASTIAGLTLLFLVLSAVAIAVDRSLLWFEVK